jgi:hypothetical protein
LSWQEAIQTITAVGQVVTAALIVVLTWRLAAATDAYAKSAKDQVGELVEARLATIQPYLHLVTAGARGEPDPYFVGLGIEAELLNLGSGPAIDAVARLWHDRLQFTTETAPQTVATGGRCEFSFNATASKADPGAQDLM